ncbi:hypothetical protein KAFR_0L01910 [Kazachstania africana CBS 2517]|uniref:Amino acid transporter transmembrane domain-containing protein n=1 Tax=Kazachstania africana (strain ATCC 22294 / BCRC 22015 / CBS 2517 / CECT 1963 / NBRC 1671 / NRRL Y-8276) TaxID=1071382 RepID=H2B2F1_KAZAF|nr:hypothetical protein KAFR_0L01910 [Kazachstania africana CBS 2517]CCF60801.1 hypothetical protein KAFR_0L01910 [Kazachstania africana CBS 2517]
MPSSIRSGVITLLHTACGAGILAMPYAFKPFGLVPGFLMIAICGFCALSGLILQAQVAKYTASGSASFFTLSQLISPSLSVVFDLAIAVKCFGVGVSYMIVVGDLMPQIFAVFTTSHILLNRDFHISLIMLFIVSPLCFLRKLNSLRYASMIAISAVAYLCVLVVAHFIFQTEDVHDLKGVVSIGLPKHEPSPLTTLPIFVFAYTCHHNFFSVINEQSNIAFTHIKKIPIIAMILAYLLYILIGFSGYLTFGDNIVGNIITLYPRTASSTIGRLAIVFLVMLAFPLQCHPCRASIHHIWHYIQEKNSNEIATQPINVPPDEEDTLLAVELIEEDSPKQPEEIPLRGKRFNIITVCILLFSYTLAISVNSLAKVLAIVGATGSTSISFILPGIFGFKLIGSEFSATSSPLPKSARFFRYLGLFLSIWGLFVMIASLAATLLLGVGH